ncbi:hypothetical protein SLEP1_g8921 [Rubroshorea leprosula]|uniref:Uncharacterized protein n=1 Tax=Rubroshorea leprosula TaxID=152421 RepID=A0AAV5I3C0_9ROSI|nr:hypothetical protein SLEP1_g8921 [Rubroshorea leprosula]
MSTEILTTQIGAGKRLMCCLWSKNLLFMLIVCYA